MSDHWVQNRKKKLGKQKALEETTVTQLSLEWSHKGNSSTDSKVRTTNGHTLGSHT